MEKTPIAFLGPIPTVPPLPANDIFKPSAPARRAHYRHPGSDPGRLADIIASLSAHCLSLPLGQRFIIENAWS
jgi:hypothetical protein